MWVVGLRQLVLGMGEGRTETWQRLGKQRPHSWLPSTGLAYMGCVVLYARIARRVVLCGRRGWGCHSGVLEELSWEDTML